MSDAWEIAKEVKGGDHITVWYDSRRSDEEQQMKGKVTSVTAGHSWCRVHFTRGDGQACYVNEEGKLVSKGSSFPITGQVKDYSLRDWEVAV